MAPETPPKKLVIWQITDGRRGHLTQIQGLTQALSDLVETEVYALPVQAKHHYWLELLAKRFSQGEQLPKPDLILAAGHKTHLAALAARRTYAGRLVVMMKPSLPTAWFDLCLIPAHDNPPARNNIIQTQGAINTVRPTANHDPALGLIIVGGPSKHHDWDESLVIGQVENIVSQQNSVRFVISDSPRTPESTRKALAKFRDSAEIIHWQDYPQGDIQKRMEHSGQVWVSEDSVSMLYEAITSLANTGVINTSNNNRETRISLGLRKLATEYQCMRPDGLALSNHQTATRQLNEAARCARLILEQNAPSRKNN